MNIQSISYQLATKITSAFGQDGARLMNGLQYAILRLWASGTTANRPRDPILGQLYYDTTLPSTVVCTAIRNGATPAVWAPLGGGGGGGTVTSITATNPIVVSPSPITTTGIISHAASGVTAATYGDTHHTAQLTVEADGHVTNASNIPISLFVGAGNLFFGDGRDGAFVLDGVNTYALFTLSGSTYTAIGWIFATNITINSGISLFTGNFLIFVNGTLTNNGTIGNFGQDASGQFGTAGFGAFYFPLNPHSSNGAETAGTPGFGSGTGTNSLGGNGGNSGAAAGGAGASGGPVVAPSVNAGGVASAQLFPYPLLGAALYPQGVLTALTICSGSGAAGAGDGVTGGIPTGGGGGGAAGYCWLAAKVLAGNGTISCKGGIGGDGAGIPPAANSTGGGGGGGGGCLWFFTTTPNPGTVNTITVAGGAHGHGVNGGNDGTDGIAGNAYVFVVT